MDWSPTTQTFFGLGLRDERKTGKFMTLSDQYMRYLSAEGQRWRAFSGKIRHSSISLSCKQVEIVFQSVFASMEVFSFSYEPMLS